MLVALSVLAVLTGFSAIGYVAVQQNANVVSKAAPSDSITDAAAAMACTTDQYCIDLAMSFGFCMAGYVCPKSGDSISCVKGMCTFSLTDSKFVKLPKSLDDTKNCSTRTEGDYDCSGAVDCADLSLFVSEFTGRTSTKTADISGDGRVSLIDFEHVRARVFAGSSSRDGTRATCQL